MCLAVLAIDHSRRYPLVVAANRDEFFDRPAARMGWWHPAPDLPEILGGRDLSSSGTWFGLTAAGRMALLTNIRDPRRQDPAAPSRGTIVPGWLTTSASPDRYWVRTALTGHNGFNLITADFARGDCWWMSSAQASPVRLESGLFGLSNGRLDEPWPKVERLRGRVDEHLRAASGADTPPGAGADALAQALLAALADRTPADDDALPSTGIPTDLERQLSPIFIRTRDGRYGTRCSTVLITERVGRHLVTRVYERSYPAGPGLALMRRAELRDWPPRYQTEPVLVSGAPSRTRAHRGSADSPVSEDALDEHDATDPTGGDDPPPGTRVIRPRVRSLLKPARPRARGA